MLNSVIYLSANYQLFNNWQPAAGERIYPSLLLDGDSKEQILAAYHYCNDLKIENFSIAVQLNSPLDELYMAGLISFFFIPGYLTVNSKKIVALLGASNEILQDAKQRLLKFSVSQGIENLLIHCTLPGEPNTAPVTLTANSSLIFSNTDSLLRSYKQAADPGILFFLPNSPVDTQELLAMITTAENEIKNNNPSAYRLAMQIQQVNTENDLLKKKNLSVVNELNNYKLHLETMRSSHEATELQEYYNGEYESLPLWYKRFGHIVKVLTGKRSFRSLFSDNPKKHSH